MHHTHYEERPEVFIVSCNKIKDYVPVPINATFCGLPPPSSYTETSAVRLPLTKGLNVTLMKQLAPEATLLPHVLVSAKSPASAPMIAMPLILTVTLPLLVSVIFFGRLLALLAESQNSALWEELAHTYQSR
jgi:hypothetical protein